MRSVEITIPVLNEQDSLDKNIRAIHQYLHQSMQGQAYAWTLVIADNGSTDQTQKIGMNLAREMENVKYLRLEKRGVGLALKTSWLAARSDYIGYFDLDMATDLKHVTHALTALDEGCDLCYGSRLHPDARVVGRSLKREVTSRVFNLILRNYLQVKLSDGMCGFKFLRRSVLDPILSCGAHSDGWFFCTELLVVGDWHGYKMKELPVMWRDSPQSKVRILKLSWEYLKAMRVLKKAKKHG